MATIACPKCGTENPANATNCKSCRVNLKYALEHLDEMAFAREHPDVPEPTKQQAVQGTRKTLDDQAECPKCGALQAPTQYKGGQLKIGIGGQFAFGVLSTLLGSFLILFQVVNWTISWYLLGMGGLFVVEGLHLILRYRPADVKLLEYRCNSCGEEWAQYRLRELLLALQRQKRPRPSFYDDISEAAMRTLVQGVTETDGNLRKETAIALGNLGGSKAIEALVQLSKDSNSGVCRAALDALAKVGEPAAVRAIAASASDQRETVRWLAYLALSKVRSPDAAETLRELLDHDDKYVVSHARTALRSLDQPKAVGKPET